MSSADSPSRTEPASEIVNEAMAALRRQAERWQRLSLVVQHEEAAASATLQPGVPVVVGRSAPADVVVRSPRMSRAHARFTLGPEGRVRVEDLGSTNGTWIRGERVAAAEILPGEAVLVGDAVASVQASAPVAVSGQAPPGGDEPIAGSPAMRELLATAARVAASRVPVVLHGETGTGKEVVARYVHARSPRHERPLVSVNCAAIPAQLVESTLFGHERGAFTGAAQRQKGIFEEADGGTVFLDEIAELPLSAQAVLLRVLEDGRFFRVGSPREVEVDVRVIAATHQDLEAMCAAGRFRSDLYYRLSVVVLAIPPLRERRDDIPALAQRFARLAGHGRVRAIGADALARLGAYAWPGNVRELRNVIERAVVLSTSDVLGVADLPAKIRELGASAAPTPPSRATLPPSRPDEPVATGGDPSARPGATPPGTADLRARLAEYETRLLVETLEATGWNQSEAARRLGMPARTVSNKIKALGLTKPRGAG